MVSSGTGILSNWWRTKGTIASHEIPVALTTANLDAHLHRYATYGAQSPFVSLAAGFVQRDRKGKISRVISALDIALGFATKNGTRPGALFYCWTIVGLGQSVEVSSVSEPVRDTLVYRRWSPYQHQGEVTAKLSIPANQIKRVEWWDMTTGAIHRYDNPSFISPHLLANYRDFF
jgi:hypothetical protein